MTKQYSYIVFMFMTKPRNGQAPSAAVSRQREKSDAMRGRICDAATVRLSRAGYHRMTIQDVVKKAAISTGALQHHFPTKEALVIAVAERLLSRSVRWFHRAKAELGSGAFPEMIRRSWREQFRTDDYGALLEILVAARTDKSLRTSVAPALERWRDAGADIDGERVRIPRGLARELIKTAPKEFTQHARNPEKSVVIGGRNLVLAPVYGPPFVRDAQ
ncbi:MAG TPA: trimethylamine methyltransferase family protein, partial [Amphiplicatus sp.]|nr:trimethylamine methyltransferase family protein [Amphiplicatus sp.]